MRRQTSLFDDRPLTTFRSHPFLYALYPTTGQADKKAWVLLPLEPVEGSNHANLCLLM